MTFSNANLDVNLLPTVRQPEFIPLEKGYHQVILLENFIATGLLLIGFLVLYFWGDLPEIHQFWYVPVIGIGVLMGFVFWFRPKAFSRKGYQLRERDIIFRTGLWWQTETVIPFVRVQHSEVTQGPLGRLFGYATLNLYTAGGSKSDLSIPALHPETARKLEQFVSQKAGLDETE
ncbi:MAG TPA: hypothetical protein ENK85_04510 [Saprospiraceae bacterium]|nr:hypothetical protein [Saprospiraceae bacterium]